jgi:hypothetical protein
MVDETDNKTVIPNYNFTNDDREYSDYVRKKKKELLDKETELKLMKIDAEMEDAKTEKFISRLARVTQLSTLTGRNVEELPIEDIAEEGTDMKSILEIVKLFKGNNTPVSVPQVEVSKSPPITQPVEQSYSNEQIEAMIAQTPTAILQTLKGYNDLAIKDVLIGKFGAIDKDTIERGIKLLRSK